MKKGGRILTSTSRFRKGAPPATVNWSHTTERKRERNWGSHNRTHTCATAVRAYTGTDQSRPWESSGLFPSPDQPRQGNHREQFGYYVKTKTPLWAERIGTRRGHTQHFWEQQQFAIHFRSAWCYLWKLNNPFCIYMYTYTHTVSVANMGVFAQIEPLRRPVKSRCIEGAQPWKWLYLQSGWVSISPNRIYAIARYFYSALLAALLSTASPNLLSTLTRLVAAKHVPKHHRTLLGAHENGLATLFTLFLSNSFRKSIFP